jgi:hypothetical protein
MVLTRSRVAKNGHAGRGAAVDLIVSNWEDEEEEEESACDNVAALSAKAKEDAMLSEDAIAADREKATDPKTWPAGRPRSRTNNTKTTSKSKLQAYEFSKKKKKKTTNKLKNTVCSEGKKQSSIMAREIRKHCTRGKRETRERTRAPRQKRRAGAGQSHLHASPAGRPQTDNCIHPTTSTDYGTMVVSSFRLRG